MIASPITRTLRFSTMPKSIIDVCRRHSSFVGETDSDTFCLAVSEILGKDIPTIVLTQREYVRIGLLQGFEARIDEEHLGDAPERFDNRRPVLFVVIGPPGTLIDRAVSGNRNNEGTAHFMGRFQ